MLAREMAGDSREGAAVAEAGVAVVHAPGATLPPAPPLEKGFRCGYETGSGARSASGRSARLRCRSARVPTGRSMGYG